MDDNVTWTLIALIITTGGLTILALFGDWLDDRD